MLSELQRRIVEGWHIGPDNFPRLEGLSQEEVDRFIRHHALRHLHKSLGALEVAEEPLDHTMTPSVEKSIVEERAAKLIVSTLVYASAAGVSGDALIAYIESMYSS